MIRIKAGQRSLTYGETLQLFFVDIDAVSGSHGRYSPAASSRDRAEEILFAEPQEAGHLTAGLSILERAMKVHFGRRKNRRARASLADNNRKPLGADNRRDGSRALESADVREFDLQ